METLHPDIQRSYDSFIKLMSVCFKDNTLTPLQNKEGQHKDTVYLFSLSRQILIDDFLTAVMEDEEIRLLYLLKSLDNSKYQCVIYNLPYDGRIFSVNILSSSYGLINSIELRLFLSMEYLFNQLKKSLQLINNQKWEIVEQETPVELFSNFAN